jgi:glycosyltransferase involved in cell wall biosynthesis
MRLLIYSRAFPPQVGGAETVTLSLARGLAQALGSDSGGEITLTVATEAARQDFPDRSLPFRVARQPTLCQLVRLVAGADVVHLAGPAFLPMLLALLCRKLLVVGHHGFQAICPNGQLFHGPTQMPCPGHFMAGRHFECLRCNANNGWLQSLRAWLLTFPRRWICGLAAAHVAPTHWLASVLQLPRTAVLHHGVPVSPPDPLSFSLATPPTFVFVGRLVSTKGVGVLLQAAQRVKAKGLLFSLKIVGEGPERAALEAQVRTLQLSDRVAFLNYLPADELQKTLAEARAVVMPSLSGEVFGMVAAENMMCGRLLIVSRIGALAEVVGEAGLTFPPGDSQALAACLERTLESDGFAETLRARAHQRGVECFSEAGMIKDHIALYRRLQREGDCLVADRGARDHHTSRAS